MKKKKIIKKKTGTVWYNDRRQQYSVTLKGATKCNYKWSINILQKIVKIVSADMSNKKLKPDVNQLPLMKYVKTNNNTNILTHEIQSPIFAATPDPNSSNNNSPTIPKKRKKTLRKYIPPRKN